MGSPCPSGLETQADPDPPHPVGETLGVYSPHEALGKALRLKQ